MDLVYIIFSFLKSISWLHAIREKLHTILNAVLEIIICNTASIVAIKVLADSVYVWRHSTQINLLFNSSKP